MKQQSALPEPDVGAHKKRRHGGPTPEVVTITNAAVAHSEEMRQRMIKYAVTMGIRMVCLALVFVFDGWFKIIPVVGAVILPWVAVMIANGGSDISQQETVDLLDEAPLPAVSGSSTTTDDAAPSPGEVLRGEIVPDDEAEAENGTTPVSTPQEAKNHEHL